MITSLPSIQAYKNKKENCNIKTRISKQKQGHNQLIVWFALGTHCHFVAE